MAPGQLLAGPLEEAISWTATPMLAFGALCLDLFGATVETPLCLQLAVLSCGVSGFVSKPVPE